MGPILSQKERPRGKQSETEMNLPRPTRQLAEPNRRTSSVALRQHLPPPFITVNPTAPTD